MPTANPAGIDLGYAIKLPPKDAIAYFESKGYEIGWNWQDVWQAKHTQAFTVAKVARLDILQTLRDGTLKVLKEGLTERDFIQAMTPELKRQGWWGVKFVTDSNGNTERVQEGSPHRLKTIYRTNLQAAYQAGRYQQQLDNAEARPYWQYISIRDSVTRPSHRKFHGRAFRYDDPIWQSLYPPNDWGCRCRVRALTAAQVERMGLTVESSDGYLKTETVDAGTNPHTGEVYIKEVTGYKKGKIQLIPGAGWSYNVGDAANQWQGQIDSALRIVTQADPALTAAAAQQLKPLIERNWQQWLPDALSGKDRNRYGWLGVIPERDLAVLAAIGKLPLTGEVMFRPGLIHGPKATRHQKAGNALSQIDLLDLPAAFANATAMLQDLNSGKILFILPGDKGRPQLSVELDMQIQQPKRMTNAIRSAYIAKASDLRDRVRRGDLKMLRGSL